MTMYPTGTHVTIRSVDHLPGKHKRLIGRQGIVGDHENGMNILTATGWAIGGHYAFPDSALTVTGRGTPPAMPRRYRVRGYSIDQES
jgi:hypothetical protein